jgi:hypothetical protein
MGYTWEHPFHHHLKRGMVLETLAGGAGLEPRIAELAHESGVPAIRPIETWEDTF